MIVRALTELQIFSMLARSVECLNSNDISAAEGLLRELIDARPDLPQALMLMGVTQIERSRYDAAETVLSNALAFSPGQPQILFYLGNARRGLSDFEGALTAYCSALQVRPDFPDAELALASTLCTLGRHSEAEKTYRGILQRIPDHARARLGLGAALNVQDHPVEAEIILATIALLGFDLKERADVEYNLGLAKLKQRRFSEALAHFEQALVLTSDNLDAERYRAIALEFMSRSERAVAVYNRILARDPLDTKTHLMLNELLHRNDKQSEMLRSYDRASMARPTSPIPLTAKGDQLMLLDRFEEAERYYQRAIRLSSDHVAAHIGLGRALTALGEYSAANAAFEKSMKMFPDDPDLHTAFSFHLLKQSDQRRATQVAERAVALNMCSQPALAVLSLCYRVNNDERGEELSGFDTLIQVFDLEPPEGYSSMNAFNDDLREHLEKSHGNAHQFFSQTLRGGTRMSEDIFQYRHMLRNKLKCRVTEAIERYIGAFKQTVDHPFLRRRTASFAFAGSWSSRASSGGYHVNHIHSGWISSVYYVEVPGVANDTFSKQGWLKFGEPSVDIGLYDAIRRVVNPKPGRLVLFPSYTWHGTIPFAANETRTTVAFDVIPH
jgi:tetratricopeptide (TPR) repeat protein